MASLIILCCNQVDLTRQCLESVLRHTRPPYELVLIDNGSTVRAYPRMSLASIGHAKSGMKNSRPPPPW
jgi:GT2 family glycosyltransferase